MRQVFNGLQCILRIGVQWRTMPNDMLLWQTAYQRERPWLKAGVFEDIVRNL